MDILLLVVIAATSSLAAVFAFLSYLKCLHAASGPQLQRFENVVRTEADRMRQATDESARGMRVELSQSVQRFQDSTLNAFAQLGETLRGLTKEAGDRLDAGILSIDGRVAGLGTKLDTDMKRMADEASQNREALRSVIEGRLDDAAAKQSVTARETREELANRFANFGENVAATMTQYGEHQKERLDNVTGALTVLTENLDRSQEGLRTTVERGLDLLRQENSSKLDEMRHTVDERLQTTLDVRLGESFNRVVEHLQRVHEGIGQMQALAADVGDLSRVLTNVRVRGTLGEVQLEGLLEQFLAPQQYVKNAQVRENSQERVEYAIKFPGRDGANELLLPVDAKFPRDDFERLLLAIEDNDLPGVVEAGKALEAKVRACAKDIRDKYINPPRTTEFAVLFLPVEGLYAEVLRRPGLFEALHREYRVTLAGPTTLCALLNAFQMGFKSLALEKRSSEVWQVLGAVQTEFQKYNGVVEKLGNQLSTAANSVGELGKRTRIMSQKLRAVEKPPEVMETPAVHDASLVATPKRRGSAYDELIELLKAPDVEEGVLPV